MAITQTNFFTALRAKYAALSVTELKTLSVIVVVSIVQGIISCCDIIWSYIYEDDFLLTPSQASDVTAALQIPWTAKILWGFASDGIPLFGYKRKSYMIVTSILGGLCVFAFGMWYPAYSLGFAILMILNITQAFQSVVTQALIAENAQIVNKKSDITDKEKTQAATSGVSTYFGAKFFGRMIYSLLMTFFLVEDQDHQFLLATSAVFIPTIFISFILPETRKQKKNKKSTENTTPLLSANEENPVTEVSSPEDEFKRSPINFVWSFIKRIILFFKDNPLIWKSFILMFLSTFAPSAGQAKFYYYTTVLGFSASFMSTLRLISGAATVVAIMIYSKWFGTVNLRRFYGWTILLSSCLTLTQLILILGVNNRIGIPDGVFAGLDTFVSEVFGELNGLPVLVLACRLCPENVEATIFALLISASDLSITVSQTIGASIVSALGITQTNFDNLWVMIIITATFQYSPFLVLWSINYETNPEKSDPSNLPLGSSQEEMDVKSQESQEPYASSSQITVV